MPWESSGPAVPLPSHFFPGKLRSLNFWEHLQWDEDWTSRNTYILQRERLSSSPAHDPASLPCYEAFLDLLSVNQWRPKIQSLLYGHRFFRASGMILLALLLYPGNPKSLFPPGNYWPWHSGIEFNSEGQLDGGELEVAEEVSTLQMQLRWGRTLQEGAVRALSAHNGTGPRALTEGIRCTWPGSSPIWW